MRCRSGKYERWRVARKLAIKTRWRATLILATCQREVKREGVSRLTAVAKIMLNAEQMRSLPQCFTRIADPSRSQGRGHRLPVGLGIAAGARLRGMRGYKAISGWAEGTKLPLPLVEGLG